MFTPKRSGGVKKQVDIPQERFPKGYVSVLSDSRIPIDGLADLTNMVLEQDSVPRPRPPLAAYGQPLLGTSLGQGTFIKMVAGAPQYWEISMQSIGGVGVVCTRKDGGTWSQVGGTYSNTAWTMFTQAANVKTDGTQQNRVYISNGSDAMSYYDIDAATLTTYTSLTTPSAPTVTPTGLSGSNFTYYYKISANNAGGESTASASGNHAVSLTRDQWDSTTNYVTVTWSAVSGATSYNIYVSDISGQEVYLATVAGLTFKDDGSTATNDFKLFPVGNSSAGPKLTNLVNMDNQLFGVGDPANPQYLWYSGQAQHLGDFSFNPNGGGYVGIDYGGSTVPVAVRPFHDGKGNPVLTVLTKGAAGRGKLYHVTFSTTTVGTTLIVFPNVYEASGQDGTVSANAVAEYNNSLYYPTGTAFKTTGTKQGVINILATDNIGQQIQPDINNLNLSSMSSCVGLEYQGKIYFALPTGSSTTNNEIWICDLTRGGLWILRWTVAAKHMWLYQDNSGITHFLVLVNGVIMEFIRSATATADNGTVFNTRVAGGAMVFDKAGVSMASVYKMRFKFLYPTGTIQINISGIGETGDVTGLANNTFISQVSFTGYGQLLYSNADTPSLYSDDVGVINFIAQSVEVVPIEVGEIVNEIKWEVLTNSVNCDYLLSSVNTTAFQIPNLYYGD